MTINTGRSIDKKENINWLTELTKEDIVDLVSFLLELSSSTVPSSEISTGDGTLTHVKSVSTESLRHLCMAWDFVCDESVLSEFGEITAFSNILKLSQATILFHDFHQLAV